LGAVPRQSPYDIRLSDEEHERLERAAARYTSPYFEVVRAKIVLYASVGMENQEIADRLDLPRQIVSKWRKRFFEHRLEGLYDDPRTGRPPGFSPSRGRAGKGSRL
jgi:DNA-directed RNA polymerase specialized sigma24 family protein